MHSYNKDRSNVDKRKVLAAVKEIEERKREKKQRVVAAATALDHCRVFRAAEIAEKLLKRLKMKRLHFYN